MSVHVTQGELLTLPTAARRLGVGYTTLWRLAREDRLPVPVVELGGRRYIPGGAVDDLLAQRKDQRSSNDSN